MSDSSNPYTRLLSLAVHELRTPAGVIGGYLRMLAHDTDQPLSDRHAPLVRHAQQSCARLVEIVAELSEIERLDEGLTPMAQQPLDFFVLVGEVATSLPDASAREVRLEVRGAASGARINGDAVRLRSALSAVFRAIVRETPGPATLAIDRRLVDDEDGVTAVTLLADAQRVSSAYDAPRRPFDEHRGGLGLALPLARRIIAAHGGRLWTPGVEAEEPARRAAAVSLPIS